MNFYEADQTKHFLLLLVVTVLAGCSNQSQLNNLSGVKAGSIDGNTTKASNTLDNSETTQTFSTK